jgi:hypothetical protein
MHVYNSDCQSKDGEFPFDLPRQQLDEYYGIALGRHSTSAIEEETTFTNEDAAVAMSSNGKLPASAARLIVQYASGWSRNDHVCFLHSCGNWVYAVIRRVKRNGLVHLNTPNSNTLSTEVYSYLMCIHGRT